MRGLIAITLAFAAGSLHGGPYLTEDERDVLIAAAMNDASERQYVYRKSQAFCRPYDFDTWNGEECIYPQSLAAGLLDGFIDEFPPDLQRALVERNADSVSLEGVSFGFGSSSDAVAWEAALTPYSTVYLSLPGFSADGKFALIVRSFTCHNDGDCGAGVVLLLQKSGAGWVVSRVRRLYVG